MKNIYKEIHVWDFPPTKTRLIPRKKFREKIIEDFLMSFKTWKECYIFLNKESEKYEIKRRYTGGILSHWKKGHYKNKRRNMPLWAVLVILKRLSKNIKECKILLHLLEKNLICYTSQSKGKHVYAKFPIYITPEMVSIVFHFCGDGYIGKGSAVSHYRQMSKEGLENFKRKLNNIFGDFDVNESQFREEGRLNIPRVISDFYNDYFCLNYSNWDTARIPENIKMMPKEFLLAGLNAFIVDEGHIGDVIEIYSANFDLLNDIRDIAIKLGYYCFPIKKKMRYEKFDQYRFLVSLKSSDKFYKDTLSLTKKFPTCGLVQKSDNLERIIKRRKRGWLYRENGITKNMIMKLLEKERTVKELANKLDIGQSSLREHLRELEKGCKITKVGKIKQAVLWKKLN